MKDYMLLFIASALIAFALTPFVRKLAYRMKAIDIPKDERRIHKKPMPRMGGLAIYLSFVICSLFYMHFSRHVIGIILGGLVLIISGIVDDIRPIKPLTKLTFQIIAALILIMFGVTVRSITNPFITGDGSMAITYLGIPITIIWVVGITNAVNLIDGLDGLACGICAISSITLFLVSVMNSRMLAVNMTIILAGACIGFLPYNFNPAKIFMGDTGSQFLGFALAAISTQGAMKSAAAVAVAVPILALGLPIYDTLFAMVRRKINRRPMMEADRGHLHHKLLDLGLTQRQVVLIMYAMSAVLGLTSVLAMKLPTRKSYALLVVVCSVILSMAVELGLFTRRTKVQPKSKLQ